ncbi:MAG: hypothetical protein ORN98_06930 [Alphaproteobacteria bacterium]|nr:hypothetical protein [Alphaproteobacteria bacterium]
MKTEFSAREGRASGGILGHKFRVFSLMALMVFAVLLTAWHPTHAADPFKSAPAQQSPAQQGTLTSEDPQNTATSDTASPAPWSQPVFMLRRMIAEAQARVGREINTSLSALKSAENSPNAVQVWAIALGLAFLYGVFHTIGPGHGKAVVISYFLSGQAKFWRGASIGIRIATTHVFASLIAVVGVTLIIRSVIPISFEDMTLVKILSYGAVILVGVLLLADAIRARFGKAKPILAHGHAHTHEHGHDHGHHGHQRPERGNLVSIVAGFVPCTGSIIILLFSIANNMLWQGSLLVAMIGVGMAVTMMALGMLAIFARSLLMRWAQSSGGAPRESRVELVLSLASPIVVIAVGTALLVTSLST